LENDKVDPQNIKGDPHRLDKLRALHPCYSKLFEAEPKKDQGKDDDKTGQRALKAAAEATIIQACNTKLTSDPATLALLDYIGRFGLQNIAVYVDGVMTVDIDLVPASIDQVVFEGDASKADFWAVAGERKGALQCRFCPDGQFSILEADSLGITDLKTIAEGSDDHKLNFSFKLTKPIETGQTLTFVITKKSTDPKKGNQEIKSTPFTYTVNYTVVSPSITGVTVQGGKVTVAGTAFFSTKTNPITVALHSDVIQEKDLAVTLPDGQTADKLMFDVPSGLSAGCWTVNVTWNKTPLAAPAAANQRILSEAAPKLTEAKRNDNSIAVKGEQLVDTSACKGKKLTFQLVKSDKTTLNPKVTARVSSSEVTLELPDAAKTGDWMVQAVQDSTPLEPAVNLK
jgi:hypothetical protein